MTDFHIHSEYSFDGSEQLEGIVLASIKKGIKRIAITDHLEFEKGKFLISKINLKKYISEIGELKIRYNDKIEILCGIELGYEKQHAQKLADYIKDLRFDYVINAVHVVDGIDCYFADYYKGKDKQTAYSNYFNAVLDSLDAPYKFDTIAHLGYVVRMSPYLDKTIYYKDFAGVIDKILLKIIAEDKFLEVNSNAKDDSMPLIPNVEILKRYKELGGNKLIFGSDAHKIERIGDNYDKVLEVVKILGLDF